MSRVQSAATATPLSEAVPASDVGVGGAPAARKGPDWPVVVLGILIVAAGALVLWDAMRVGQRVVRYGLPPGLVPTAIGGGLALMGVLVAIEGYRGLFPERERDRIAPILWIVGGLVLQIAVLKVAGFSVATAFVFSFTAMAMGRGPVWLTWPIGFVFCFLIWIAFSQALNLALPAGPPERAFLDLIRPAPPAPAAPSAKVVPSATATPSAGGASPPATSPPPPAN